MVCCVAVGCSARPGRGISFHRFPRDPERRQQWAAKVRRIDGWKPNDNSYLCEKHFDSSQYEQHRMDGCKKLKPNAVPTIFSYSAGKAEQLHGLQQSPTKRTTNEPIVMSTKKRLAIPTPSPTALTEETSTLTSEENSAFHQEDFKTEFPDTISEPDSPHSANSFGWTTASATATNNQQPPGRQGKRRPPEDDNFYVVRNGAKYYIPDEDQFDVFGKNVAFKLRQMAQMQRIHAEKIISDVLYEGELGNLSRAAHLEAPVN